MKLIDCHNHSKHSFDGAFSVIEMVSSAREKGISVYAITDHADTNFFKEHNLPSAIQNSIADINKLKNRFSDLKIIAGVELGQCLHDTKKAEIITSIDGLDFIIGSLHNVLGEKDFYHIDFKNESYDYIKDLLNRYFLELIEMAKCSDIDVLGHLTYPFRYIAKAMNNCKTLKIPLDIYDEQIYEVLKQTIESGKGIEINTSTFSSELGEPMPNEKYLKMYKQLGGEILSIGSDAHTIEKVGRNILEAHMMVQNIGFKYITYFENRKPIMIKL